MYFILSVLTFALLCKNNIYAYAKFCDFSALLCISNTITWTVCWFVSFLSSTLVSHDNSCVWCIMHKWSSLVILALLLWVVGDGFVWGWGSPNKILLKGPIKFWANSGGDECWVDGHLFLPRTPINSRITSIKNRHALDPPTVPQLWGVFHSLWSVSLPLVLIPSFSSLKIDHTSWRYFYRSLTLVKLVQ